MVETTRGNEMKLLIPIALLLLLISEYSRAECPNVVRINTGTVSPCNGWLVSENQMQEFARNSDKLANEQGISQLNKQLLSLSAAEIEFYRNRSKSQSKELEKSESRRFWATAGAFALGVIITGVAAKAAIESAK